MSFRDQQTIISWMNCQGPKEVTMARVEINSPAPDFALNDFRGQPVCLSDFRGQRHVVLVFNRGFT